MSESQISLSQLRRRIARLGPQVTFFLLALLFCGAQGGAFHTTFNNFLADTYDISAQTRGLLEFPRELPGLLVTLMAGLLAFLPETRVGGVALLCSVAGLWGLAGVGYIDNRAIGWPLMILFMFAWSVGGHLIMPVSESIGMSLGTVAHRGRKLGQVRAAGAVGGVAGAGMVWVLTELVSVPSWRTSVTTGLPTPPYWLVFGIGGLFALVATILLLRIREIGSQTKRPRLIIRRQYWLYYVLSLLFGARKQAFLTFAPWVLIRIFNQPPSTFAKLWIVAAGSSLFIIPTVGKLIDRFGERRLLMANSVLILLICMVYGFAYRWGITGPGLWLTLACYILDELLFSVEMARSTYLSKIVENPDDLPASLSLGVSLDHAVGMSVPALGGWMWDRGGTYGHRWVFAGAACVAVLMGIFASMIRVPDSRTPSGAPADEDTAQAGS
jgi:MFS family permease